MAQSRRQYTNPIENLRSYIMLKAGIQKDERLSDLEWVQDKIKAGEKLARAAAVQTTPHDSLINALKEWKET